ncbi:histone deacetylase rpd3 [Anaeramoeba flamelloides]|uniref:histone deacetylase n=1 Tax=Anaeramoeba flamelloides TaxID=1746091 RepID=A0ABQ8ZE95_9EUKA|nr:histone deacetylase rpd3 [Anaeramoeba flamelloides]
MSTIKKRVSYFYDSGIGRFNYGGEHPMKPKRIRLTHNLITGYGLHSKMDICPINKSTRKELCQFHSEEYLKFLEHITPDNKDEFFDMLDQFNIGEDTPIFDGFFEFSQISAGGSIDGARKLNYGETDIAINWTGGLHHAKSKEASGFCYINDIVLGILELLKYHQRVLYIDIDIHHGDGVEEAFYQTNRVMTCSFHKYGNGYFPGTGKLSDIGENNGENYAVNVPLKDGMDDESYFYIFKKVIDAIMLYYQPSAIVLQCGADTLTQDELGCFNLSIEGHGRCVKYIKKLNKPLLVLGGGGYTPKNVAKCWAYDTNLLIGETELDNELPLSAYSLDFPDETSLHIEPSNMANENDKKTLDKMFAIIFHYLKQIEPVPSVENIEISEEIFRSKFELSDEEDDEDYYSLKEDRDEQKIFAECFHFNNNEFQCQFFEKNYSEKEVCIVIKNCKLNKKDLENDLKKEIEFENYFEGAYKNDINNDDEKVKITKNNDNKIQIDEKKQMITSNNLKLILNKHDYFNNNSGGSSSSNNKSAYTNNETIPKINLFDNYSTFFVKRKQITFKKNILIPINKIISKLEAHQTNSKKRLQSYSLTTIKNMNNNFKQIQQNPIRTLQIPIEHYSVLSPKKKTQRKEINQKKHVNQKKHAKQKKHTNQRKQRDDKKEINKKKHLHHKRKQKKKKFKSKKHKVSLISRSSLARKNKNNYKKLKKLNNKNLDILYQKKKRMRTNKMHKIKGKIKN